MMMKVAAVASLSLLFHGTAHAERPPPPVPQASPGLEALDLEQLMKLEVAQDGRSFRVKTTVRF